MDGMAGLADGPAEGVRVGLADGSEEVEEVGLVDGCAEGMGLAHVLGGLPLKAVLSTIGDPAMTTQVREVQSANA